MAFIGTAVIKQVGDNLVRITGLALINANSGTISLFGGGGEVELPDSFNPTPFEDVTLVDALEVSVHPVSSIGSLVPGIMIAKAAGPPFLVTLTNDVTIAATDALLEIYIRYH